MCRFRLALLGAALTLALGGFTARPVAASPQEPESRKPEARTVDDSSGSGGAQHRSEEPRPTAVPRRDIRPTDDSDRRPARRENATPPSAQAPQRPEEASPAHDSQVVPRISRPRESRRPMGVAIPRSLAPPPPPGLLPSVRPYIYYYYPRPFYGGFGFDYFYYDPYWWGPSYGGQGYGAYGYAEGGLRLKIKPRDAEVDVDGYYVGVVDDFDGVFQRLDLDPGPHRITVRAVGYEPLNFDVRILTGKTITYRAELKPLRP